MKTSLKNSLLRRITDRIHDLFEEYTRKYPLNNTEACNSLLHLRNLIVNLFQNSLNEPWVRKRYGVAIDSTTLVSFSPGEVVSPRSSWVPFPSDEDETRPAGITNEEFEKFLQRVDGLFVDGNAALARLHVEIRSIFIEAFLKPSSNRPFKAGTYVRFGSGNFIGVQSVPCEICGENRLIDKCHVIPRRLNGNAEIDNILFLCPTHHRLFDTCMLTRQEWDRIDWSLKAKRTQIYAEKVIKVVQDRFWDETGDGVYKKQGYEDLDVKQIKQLYRQNLEDVSKD